MLKMRPSEYYMISPSGRRVQEWLELTVGERNIYTIIIIIIIIMMSLAMHLYIQEEYMSACVL